MLTCRQALAEAVRLTAELEQVAAMREAIEQGGHQTSVVVEHAGPVGELQVAGDDQGAACVPMGEQDEEQLGLVGVETDEAQLIAYQQIDAIELLLELGQPVLGLSFRQLRHQLGDGGETDPPGLAAGRQSQPVPGGPTARITSRRVM